MSRDLSLRLLVAAIGIPAGFAVVWAGGLVLAVVVGFLAVMGSREVMGIAQGGGARPFPLLALPASALLVAAAHATGDAAAWAPVALAILALVTFGSLALAVFLRGPGEGPLTAVGSTILAVVYAGVPMSFAIFLRQHPAAEWSAPGWEGVFLLVFAMTVTWLGDSAAYFGGRAMGGRKLLPVVSPNKTISGSVSGLVGATVGAALLTFFLVPHWGGGLALGLWGSAALGLCIGVAAQVGDLAESLLKREAGVKDSGQLFPGHGGVLDRFDGIFFALPLMYGLLPFFLG